MSNSLRWLILALIAIVATAAGLFAASHVFGPAQQAQAEISSGTLLPQPRPMPEFSLAGANGQPFTKAAFAGKWSVIFVGFTHCPDVCPNTLALLKNVRRGLLEQKKDLQVVLLSVDPERDTPKVLADYVHYFDPAFLGATGPREQLDPLGTALGFVYMKVPGTTPDNYSVDHSSALILVNPQAQVAGYFTPPFKVEPLKDDLAKLIPGTV